MERDDAARGVEEHHDRSGLRGQLWLRHAAQLRREPGVVPATSITTASTIGWTTRGRPNRRRLRPFGALDNSAVTIWDHSGKSTYHSLQTQLISRFGRGSQFQASYTLSRSRANLAMTNSDGALSVGVYKLDVHDPDSDWGRPETGRDHIFNASLIWMLPALEDRSKLMQSDLRRLGDLDDRRRGHRAAASTFSSPGTCLANGTGTVGHRQLAEPDHSRSSQSDRRTVPCQRWTRRADHQPRGVHAERLAPRAASAPRGAATATAPDTSRPICRSIRTSVWAGSTRFQFRWDIFNFFNNTNFLLAGLDNTFARGQRRLRQRGPDPWRRPSPARQPSGTFGQATRARDPRQMQIGFKILF